MQTTVLLIVRRSGTGALARPPRMNTIARAFSGRRMCMQAFILQEYRVAANWRATEIGCGSYLTQQRFGLVLFQ